MNNKNGTGLGLKGWIIIILFVLMIGAMFSGGGSSSSSSSRKWSDLSEREKENARWAYEVQQEINKRK